MSHLVTINKICEIVTNTLKKKSKTTKADLILTLISINNEIGDSYQKLNSKEMVNASRKAFEFYFKNLPLERKLVNGVMCEYLDPKTQEAYLAYLDAFSDITGFTKDIQYKNAALKIELANKKDQ